MATKKETYCVVPCRFSYVHVFEPQKVEGSDDAKYSVSVIIPKADKESLQKVVNAIKAAAEEGKSAKFSGKALPADYINKVLRDGDNDRPEDDAYKGCYFLSAKCKTKPGIVDGRKRLPTGEFAPITDENEFYSGCYGYVSMNFYPYNTNGNRGVACGLNNCLKARDGEYLGGRATASNDFNDIDLPAEFASPAEEPDFIF